ncbi:hypothetical protein N311_03679, partial [Apaloderma vittatum]
PTLQRRRGCEKSTYTITLTFFFAELLSGISSFQDRLEIQKTPVTFLQGHR